MDGVGFWSRGLRCSGARFLTRSVAGARSVSHDMAVSRGAAEGSARRQVRAAWRGRSRLLQGPQRGAESGSRGGLWSGSRRAWRGPATAWAGCASRSGLGVAACGARGVHRSCARARPVARRDGRCRGSGRAWARSAACWEAGERRREVGDRVGPTGYERVGGKGREGGGGGR
jgi:hypothetical protein